MKYKSSNVVWILNGLKDYHYDSLILKVSKYLDSMELGLLS